MNKNLEQHLAILEDTLSRSIGDDTPIACRWCYASHDVRGCPCGRASWVEIPAIIAEIKLTLEVIQQEERNDINN